MYKPLPKELRLGFSDIHDIGVFAKESIPLATEIPTTFPLPITEPDPLDFKSGSEVSKSIATS